MVASMSTRTASGKFVAEIEVRFRAAGTDMHWISCLQPTTQSLCREEGDLTGQIPYNLLTLFHMFMV